MSITGAADGPPYRLGVAVADIVTGLFAAQGILAARSSRGSSPGSGQHVDVAMLDSVVALLTYQAGNLVRDRGSRRAAWAIGTRRSRRTTRSTTADGPIVLAVGQRRAVAARSVPWPGCSALAADPRFADERRARRALRCAASRCSTPVFAHAHARRLDGAARRGGRPVGAVRPRERSARGSAAAGARNAGAARRTPPRALTVLGVPVKLSDDAGRRSQRAATLGEHTESGRSAGARDRGAENASLRHEPSSALDVGSMTAVVGRASVGHLDSVMESSDVRKRILRRHRTPRRRDAGRRRRARNEARRAAYEKFLETSRGAGVSVRSPRS